MPARSRLLAIVLVAVLGLVAGSVATAGGATADPQAQRDAARAKKTQLARQLNVLSATEDELLDAAKALDDDVRVVTAQVEAARQAAVVADAELVQAQQAVDATQARVEHMARVLVGRAVARFMAPNAGGAGDLVGTDDLAESARKQTLLDTVSAKDSDLIDQLGAAKEDLLAEQRAVQAANARTIARKRETEERLAALQESRAEKQRNAAAVERRKQDVLAEIDKLAKEEAELTRIINARTKAVVGGDSSATSTGCIWPTQGFGDIGVRNPLGSPPRRDRHQRPHRNDRLGGKGW
jgi:peptidoglycan hydrolase CwlO-like protein